MPHVGDIASLDVPDRLMRVGVVVKALIGGKIYEVEYQDMLKVAVDLYFPTENEWQDITREFYLAITQDDNNGRKAKWCVVTNYERVRKQILLNLDDGAEVLVYGIIKWTKIKNGKYGILCKSAFASYTEFKRFEDLTCDALITYEKLTGDSDPEGLPF
jgi:hypothetical protein